MTMAGHYKQIVEGAGAQFLRVENGIVYFRDGDGATLSLYAFACTPENVSLALKAAREPQPAGFEPLARAEGL